MHHMEIEAREADAARGERSLRSAMDKAYAEVIQGEAVDHPSHYTQGRIECIEVLEQLAEQGVDFRILHAIRYLWRYQHKGGAESLRKAVWYIERMLKGMDDGQTR